MKRLLMSLMFVLAAAPPALAGRGTFLITEGELGFGVGDAFPEGPTGMAGGVTLGAGGKPKGWPLRFYGIMRLDWGGLAGTASGADEQAEIERDTFAWTAGLRIVAPMYRRLRLIVDTTLGGYSVETRGVFGGGAEELVSQDSSFLVGFGAGLQWRFTLGFSLGARLDVSIPTGLEAFDPIVETVGVPTRGAGIANLGFGLTATLHL